MAGRLGDILVDQGHINENELHSALDAQGSERGMLGAILLRRGLVTYQQLGAALEVQFEVPFREIVPEAINPQVVRMLPEALARSRCAIPIGVKGSRMTLAMMAPDDIETISEAELITGYQVEPVVAVESEVYSTIDKGFDDRIVARQTIVDMKISDGTVLLDGQPTFSRVAGTTDGGAGEQPIIDRSSAKTSVRVASGQTMVIGGLRQRSDVGGFNGVPFLKDLWFIGPLFRGKSTTVRESELIVFITPEIITQPTIDKPRHERAIGVGREMLRRVPQGRVPFMPGQDDCRLPPVDVEFFEGDPVLQPPPVISPPPSVPQPRDPPVRRRAKPQQQPKEAAAAKPQAARPKATYLTPQPRADRSDTKEKGPDLGRPSRRPTAAKGSVSRLPPTDRTHAETQRPSRRVEAPSWQAPSQQAHRVNRWSEKIGSRPADRSRSPDAMKSSAGPANPRSRWEAPVKRSTPRAGEPAKQNPYEAIRTSRLQAAVKVDRLEGRRTMRRLRHDPADRAAWIDDMFLP